MTPFENFLSRVKHRKTGKDRAIFHDPTTLDRHPSGSVRELDDGRLLIHLFNGTSVDAALSAVGLTFADLYPRRRNATVSTPAIRRPFFPSDVFDIARHEVGVVAIIASDMAHGKTIDQRDHARLLDAAGRLNRIAEAAYAR